MKRKSLSNKLRFEVFKRDSFTCQYCGKSAPDVVLNVDHISPVSKGGSDDIMNLITSCFDCNSGKSDRTLDDNTVISKQRAQLAELEERRQQLKAMLEWRDGLQEVQGDIEDAVGQQWFEKTGYVLTELGFKGLGKSLRKIELPEFLRCMDIACDQYLKYDQEGAVTIESVEHAWSMIPRIASNRAREKDNPELRDLYYARGILRNRLYYVNERQALVLLRQAYECGADLESLKDLCLSVRNWTEFNNTISDFISKNSTSEEGDE